MNINNTEFNTLRMPNTLNNSMNSNIELLQDSYKFTQRWISHVKKRKLNDNKYNSQNLFLNQNTSDIVSNHPSIHSTVSELTINTCPKLELSHPFSKSSRHKLQASKYSNKLRTDNK